MSAIPPATDEPLARGASDWQWRVLVRWQEFAAERRANLLRVGSIGVFYAIELLNYHGLRLGPLQWEAMAERSFHLAVTAIVFAWTMVALGAQMCLARRMFPPALKYLTTLADLLLLTGILMLADAPRSPLVVAYFLVILLAGLRMSLALVRFATCGALTGYLVLLGYARWFADPARGLVLPRYHQMMMFAALLLAGLMLGQIVRRARVMAETFARHDRPPDGGAP